MREPERSTGRHRPPRELFDLQFPPIEYDRVAQNTNLVQRTPIFALDACETVHKEVVEQKDGKIQKDLFKLFRFRLVGEALIGAKA